MLLHMMRYYGCCDGQSWTPAIVNAYYSLLPANKSDLQSQAFVSEARRPHLRLNSASADRYYLRVCKLCHTRNSPPNIYPDYLDLEEDYYLCSNLSHAFDREDELRWR